MQPLYDPAAPKKSANLSINSDLLNKARDQRINLSATLEQALREALKHKQQQQWLRENRQAIVNYNRHIEKHGVFSDKIRKF